MKKNYFKNSWDILIKSFKEFDTKVFFIVLYDLLFYSITYLSFLFFGKYIQNKALGINLSSMDEMVQISQDQLNATSSQLQNLLLLLAVGFLIITLISFIAMCIFKGLIWFKIANKKFNLNHMKKFILINFLWFLMWIIPLIILFLILKKEIILPLLTIIIILLIHFTNLLYISFTETKKLNSIKKAFQIGIKKIHLFILPYLIMFIILITVMQVYWLYNFMPGNTPTIISSIILIIYLAWFRIYLYNVVKDI